MKKPQRNIKIQVKSEFLGIKVTDTWVQEKVIDGSEDETINKNNSVQITNDGPIISYMVNDILEVKSSFCNTTLIWYLGK